MSRLLRPMTVFVYALALATACTVGVAPASASAATARFEQNAAGISSTSGWSSVSSWRLSGGTHAATELPGRRIAVRFTGDGITILGSRAASFGSFRYSVDGAAPVTVSSRASSAQVQASLAVVSGLTDGTHDLLVESRGGGMVTVDAFDVTGSAPALTAAPVPSLNYLRIEQTDPSVVMSDGWFQLPVAGMSGGSYRYSAYGDAFSEVRFNGTGIAWIGPRHPKFGYALVSVDGAAPVRIDLYAPSLQVNRVLYSAGALPAGDHTLRITVAGSRSAVSRGNLVGVDAFEISGSAYPGSVRIEDDDTRLGFGGLWSLVDTASASGSTWRQTTSRGSTARLDFTGDRVALRAPKGPGFGDVEVRLDGVLVDTIDLSAPAALPSAVVWDSGVRAIASHSVEVKVVSSAAPVIVDAFDVSGFVQSASLGKSIDQTDSRIWYAGAWSKLAHAGAHGGTLTYSRSAGAAVHIRFTGTAFEWIGRTHPNCGTAAVFVDGVQVAIVDPSRSDEAADRRIVWSVRGLSNKEHTVKIVVNGASGRGSGPTVSIDAVRTDGALLMSRPPTPFSYPWRNYIVIDKSDFKLYWVKDGYLWAVYPIAHGKAGTPTPNRVWRIDAKYYTDPTSVYGPRKMRLFKQVWNGYRYVYVYTAYAIHGTNQEWVIGTMASHGCIRMYNKDVVQLFPQVPLGTMVVTRD